MTPGNEFKQRTTLFLVGRIIIYNLLLGYFFFISPADTISRTVFFIAIICTDIVFVVSIVSQEYITRYRLFLFGQFLYDVVLITVLTFFDGGIIQSNFSLLFYLVIILASVYFYDRGSIYITTAAGILYIGSYLLLSNGVIPVYTMTGEILRAESFETGAYITIFINLILFYIACFVISNLSIAYYKKREQYEVQTVLLNDVFENIPSLLLVFDRDGKLTLWNTKATDLFRALFRGMHWSSILPEHLHGYVRSVLTGRVGVDTETRIGTHDFKVLLAPINRNNEMIGCLMNLEFITEKKRMEQRIQELDRMAYLGELGAGMAHELRNPLASLYGSIQILNESSFSEQDKELYSLVLRESERLNKIVTDFLTFVRGVNAIREDINLASLIDDVVVMLRIITSRQIHFADARYYMISGDRNLLIQAFNNIIWNAVEATNESGEVRITIEAQEQEWLVRVVDNGKGIAQEDIVHIFKPFFSRKANGTGLGLAIARKNIIANDGHIECESGDKGTEFRVYLPMGNI